MGFNRFNGNLTSQDGDFMIKNWDLTLQKYQTMSTNQYFKNEHVERNIMGIFKKKRCNFFNNVI